MNETFQGGKIFIFESQTKNHRVGIFVINCSGFGSHMLLLSSFWVIILNIARNIEKITV